MNKRSTFLISSLFIIFQLGLCVVQASLSIELLRFNKDLERLKGPGISEESGVLDLVFDVYDQKAKKIEGMLTIQVPYDVKKRVILVRDMRSKIQEATGVPSLAQNNLYYVKGSQQDEVTDTHKNRLGDLTSYNIDDFRTGQKAGLIIGRKPAEVDFDLDAIKQESRKKSRKMGQKPQEAEEEPSYPTVRLVFDMAVKGSPEKNFLLNVRYNPKLDTVSIKAIRDALYKQYGIEPKELVAKFFINDIYYGDTSFDDSIKRVADNELIKVSYLWKFKGGEYTGIPLVGTALISAGKMDELLEKELKGRSKTVRLCFETMSGKEKMVTIDVPVDEWKVTAGAIRSAIKKFLGVDENVQHNLYLQGTNHLFIDAVGQRLPEDFVLTVSGFQPSQDPKCLYAGKIIISE